MGRNDSALDSNWVRIRRTGDRSMPGGGGHEVFCTDIDEKRIDLLKAGKVPIYEEHLDEVLKRAAAEKKISYTSDAGEAIRAGEVIFICVGTTPKESSKAG